MFDYDILDVEYFPSRTARPQGSPIITLPRTLLEGFEKRLAERCHKIIDNHAGYLVTFRDHIEIGEAFSGHCLYGNTFFFWFHDFIVRISDGFEEVSW